MSKSLDYESPSRPSEKSALVPTMGVVALTLYGIGDMLGSGIYAAMGAYAGAMGNTIWLAFVSSAVAAMLTGLTYASLGSRYPKAAGAAYVTQRAFGMPLVSYVLGLTVMASGLTSMGTATHGVAGYIVSMLKLDGWAWKYAVIAVFILIVTAINLRGMKESVWANAFCTLIEVGGLLLIVAVGMRYWGSVNYLETPPPRPGYSGGITPVFLLSGAVLTFYSFVGFEDMLNVSEEVKNPRRTFPIGLLLAVAITTVIYIAVGITAISVVPHATLAQSKQPMVDVMKTAAPWFKPIFFTLISVFAIANTALLNYIMGSRLVYGMARQGLLPAPLGRVLPTRRTPYVAILTLMVIVSILVVVGDLKPLMSATSLLLLIVFTLVNASWIVLRRRPGEPRGGFEVHWLVPLGGMIVSLALILTSVLKAFRGDKDVQRSLLISAALVGVIIVLYFLRKPGAAVDADPAE